MARPQRNNRTIVGLDIEPGFVAAVQARKNGRLLVERSASSALAPGVMSDGEVADVPALAEALRELFADSGLPKRVRVGIANARIAVRTLELPPITDPKDLDAAVRFQAADQLPIPAAQAVIDHHSLGIVETPDGPRTRVVVVAAQRDMIDRVLDAVRQAGLRAEGIDLSAFAMIRALHEPARRSTDAQATTLYVGAGGVTNLAVAHGSTCVFTRVTPNGVETMAADLAGRRGLSLDEARGWLSRVGLATPLDQIEGEAPVVADARAALLEGVRRIADDVRTSLEFYGLQEGAEPAERVVLTGPAGSIAGFAEEFGTQLGVPVDVGSVGEAGDGALGRMAGSALAVAAGLAVEEGLA